MIQPLTEDIFTVQPLIRQTSGTLNTQPPPVSQIIYHGEALDVYLDGAVLEACFQADDRYLVFMTDDCPYEECLRIYLLDSDFSILDAVTLGRIYATGIFQLLGLAEPDTVSFQFYADRPMSLKILPQPQLCLPLLSGPRGVYPKAGFRRQLKIIDA